MAEVNEGVQIILNRMESNLEEFFSGEGRWDWIFKETLREVMSEQEKAALHAGLTKVRRLEITAKAAATVLRANEMNEREKESYPYDSGVTTSGFGMAPIKGEGSAASYWGGKK